jgi:hypothetical protein
MIRNVLPLLRHLSYYFSYCACRLIPWSLPSATVGLGIWLRAFVTMGLVAWIRFFFVNNQVLITPLHCLTWLFVFYVLGRGVVINERK